MAEPPPDARAAEPAGPGFDSKAFLSSVTTLPGVYRMKDAGGEILYVGKAGNLRNRLSSYFAKTVDNRKTARLVEQIADVEVTVTRSEAEALILENQLIKAHRPRYNILLRDDKSYPGVYVSTRDDYPRISYHRGSRARPGEYFGPYPSGWAVRKTLSFLQKLFQVRQCEDSYFRNRTRPCLQYQIKRCRAPCVGRVSPADYRQDVELSLRVLAGENREVMNDLIAQMEQAAAALDYERAAQLRDRISDLKLVADQQYVAGSEGAQADVVAIAVAGGVACVQVFFIRNGLNLGNRAYYPSVDAEDSAEEILGAFVGQYYFAQEVPGRIVLSHPIEDAELLAQALGERRGKKIQLGHNVRGERARWLEMARENADIALQQRLSSRAGQARRLDELRQQLGLDDAPGRIECFDISHTRGELTVASCVVFNAEGPLKGDYRRFDISDITPGDDYAAMRQALQRRYTRVLKEGKPLPDVLLIDGGKGQVGVAREVLGELQLEDSVVLVGVAKGPERRPGEETLVLNDERGERRLGPESPALHLIQQVRDEAHRFAIAGHRAKRGKARTRSPLEGIDGLGPKRRQALLSHFGGLQQLKRASAAEIARVPGVSDALARRVFERFHTA